MTELFRCIAAAAALFESLQGSNDITLDVLEGDDVGFIPGDSENLSVLGVIDASVSVHARELIVHPPRKRVRPGGEIRFRIASRLHQDPGFCAVASFKCVARVMRTEIALIFNDHTTTLAYSIAISADGKAQGGCVDLIVPVPEQAMLGSEIVLRRVSVAGSDVALGEAPVRVIVGFNHEHAPAGRVYAAARAGDIPALTQALDDGCSTQETGMASLVSIYFVGFV
jgi:hypothetical protein